MFLKTAYVRVMVKMIGLELEVGLDVDGFVVREWSVPSFPCQCAEMFSNVRKRD